MNAQPELKFSPWTGERLEPPQAVRAEDYRAIGAFKWIFNPWRGVTRAPADTRMDPFGLTIWEPEWGPLPAAAKSTSAPLKGVMTYAEFDTLVEETIASVRKLQQVKGAEYTGSETNRLAQFTVDGQDAGVTPLQCLLIYMSKHFGAFKTFVRDDAAGKTRERSEPIDGRLDDIIVYCVLAKAIIRSNNR